MGPLNHRILNFTLMACTIVLYRMQWMNPSLLLVVRMTIQKNGVKCLTFIFIMLGYKVQKLQH